MQQAMSVSDLRRGNVALGPRPSRASAFRETGPRLNRAETAFRIGVLFSDTSIAFILEDADRVLSNLSDLEHLASSPVLDADLPFDWATDARGILLDFKKDRITLNEARLRFADTDPAWIMKHAPVSRRPLHF